MKEIREVDEDFNIMQSEAKQKQRQRHEQK